MQSTPPGAEDDPRILHAEIARLSQVVGTQQTLILKLQQQLRELPQERRIPLEDLVRAVSSALPAANQAGLTISGAQAEIQTCLHVEDGAAAVSVSFPSAAGTALPPPFSTVSLAFRCQPPPPSIAASAQTIDMLVQALEDQRSS